jgi:hypothetical protein
MLKKIKDYISFKNGQLNDLVQFSKSLERERLNDYKSPKINIAKSLINFNNQRQRITSLKEVEFQCFSQWGDDGIIQYLIHKVGGINETFIEFGVENYTESNTRFLLLNNNWSGLVIDGSEANIEYIENDTISSSFDLHTTCAFITRDNINQLLLDFVSKGYDKEIGILSIDIDGNDYWIWEEINVINPAIVIVEYNAIFELNPWSVPYKSDFYRLDAHESYQYWGASLSAFMHLAGQKGYSFIGCNSNGNNAYFVRKDKLGNLNELSATEGFIDSKFREYKDPTGKKWGGKSRIELISGMQVVNVVTSEIQVI